MSFDSLSDELVRAIVNLLPDPADRCRAGFCSRRLRRLFPSRPLRIRIAGCRGTALSETFFVSRVAREGEDEEDRGRPFILGGVPDILSSEESLEFGTMYHFWVVRNLPNGRVRRLILGRGRRITREKPSDVPHFACRFGLSLLPSDSFGLSLLPSDSNGQTWTVSRGGGGGDVGGEVPVPFGRDVGLSVGGNNPDKTKNDNDDRRVLTSRKNDWNIVVSWYHRDERTKLYRADQFPSFSFKSLFQIYEFGGPAVDYRVRDLKKL